MAWESIIDGKGIGDVRSDRRSAKPIEKYYVSDSAVYFQGRHLPLSEVRSLRVLNSFYTPNGCCGRSLPVFKIRVDYGGEKPLVLMIEKESNVERMVESIRSANPGIKLEEAAPR